MVETIIVLIVIAIAYWILRRHLVRVIRDARGARYTDQFINDELVTMRSVGIEPTRDDIQRLQDTFYYAHAELYDSIIELVRSMAGKKLRPRLFSKDDR